MKTKLISVLLIFGVGLFITVSTVYAGAVEVDGLWYEFLFSGVGVPAEGCPPSGCVPSSGGNSVFADSSPWTFTSPPGGALLTVVDAFAAGDRFAIYDFGIQIGSTSIPNSDFSCFSDPDICQENPNYSKGEFELDEGQHSITIIPISSPFGGGAAYFKVESLIPYTNQPPICDLAGASSDRLWPPNHKFVEVSVLGVTDPEGDTITITIDSIFQDEIIDYSDEDGEMTYPDGQGVGTDKAQLRAERNDGKGDDGRFYHIGFTADDGNGGECSGEVLVGVQKDKKGTLADGGALYDSTFMP
jgi:hypothetical protein